MNLLKRATVILNPSSGLQREGAAVDVVREALRSEGVSQLEILRIGEIGDLKRTVANAIREGAEAIVAAGGDGTVSAVAGALKDSDTPLGVLPAGTLNHFAKDLDIPTDLTEAARVIAAGNSIQVDLAEVNGRVFINNSSIGIYPAMVRAREKLMRNGWPKRLAMAAGVAAAVRAFPNVSIRVTLHGEAELKTRSPFLFVGNNRYKLSGFEAGEREGLQDGVLQVCTVRNPSRPALFRTLALAIFGAKDAAPELHITTAGTARIRTLRKHIHVAVDGEVVSMTSPLEYSALPGALRVLVPMPVGQASWPVEN